MNKKNIVPYVTIGMLLTSMVHFVQLSITMPMIASGVQVPAYLQVGYWPSVSMSVEYLAWGFFMGSAFISSFFPIGLGKKGVKALKYTLLVCGILCYAGFWEFYLSMKTAGILLRWDMGWACS